MILNFIDTLNKFGKNLNSWFLNQYNNPLFWLLLFIILTVVVMMAYNYLHKR